MVPTETDAPRLLVVEDYEDSLALLTSFLKTEGYRTLTAATGEDAVRVAVKRQPDLILMDLGLPGIDGLEAIWRMRKQPELAEVPIVIISAHDSYDLREEATNAGCKGYLVKPLDMGELKQMIKTILEA